MSGFAAAALEQLPNPTVVETLEYESILDELISDVTKFNPDLEQHLGLESEPVKKLLEAMAFRLLHERQRANEQALSLMLAKAKGPQLDHLGALPFIRTPRKLLQPANDEAIPPIPAVYEDDEEYRSRLHLAMEGYSTAGSKGAYVYHGLAAHENIKDIAVDAPRFERWIPSPDIAVMLPDNAIVMTVNYYAGLLDPLPGDVALTALSRIDNGFADDEIITALVTKVTDDEIRPITDRPRSGSAEIIEYFVKAEVWFYPGPDQSLIVNAAETKLEEYTEQRHRIGHDVTESGLKAAIHRPGVQNVNILEPVGGYITINDRQAAYCTGYELINMGTAV